MRIAIVSNSFPKLSETFIYRQVTGLRANGVDVTVVVHSRNGDPEAFGITRDELSFVRESPLAVGRVSGSVGAFVRDPIRSGRHMRQAVGRFGADVRTLRTWLAAAPFGGDSFDIIHFEFSGLAIQYLDVLPLLRPAKFVMSCRGAAEQIRPLRDAERRRKLERVVRKMDLVHCVSEDMVRTMQTYGLDRDRAFVNRPAINADDFSRTRPYQARESGPFHLVSVGRLHWKKGFEYGIQAVKELSERGYDVIYSIAGAGAEEEKLRFEIHDLGLEDRAHLLGEITPREVRILLEKADIFLLTSLSEGLSNAALEAMCMGLPTVGTTAGGMDEAIEDGVSGHIVPPRRPSEMADRVAELLHSPDRRTEIGEAAAHRVREKFSLQTQTQRFLKAYRGLLTDPTAQPSSIEDSPPVAAS